MQHTTKYSLNLIEPSDEFLPEPLNENTKAVEAQLQAREAAETAMEQRLNQAIGAGGRTARIAVGSYVGGDENARTVDVDFYPIAILVAPESGYGAQFFVLLRPYRSAFCRSVEAIEVTWTDRGASWRNTSIPGDAAKSMNVTGANYYWAAIGTAD